MSFAEVFNQDMKLRLEPILLLLVFVLRQYFKQLVALDGGLHIFRTIEDMMRLEFYIAYVTCHALLFILVFYEILEAVDDHCFIVK